MPSSVAFLILVKEQGWIFRKLAKINASSPPLPSQRPHPEVTLTLKLGDRELRGNKKRKTSMRLCNNNQASLDEKI